MGGSRTWWSVVIALVLTGSAVTAAAGETQAACTLPDDPSATDCLERFSLKSGAKLPYYGSHSLDGAEATAAVIVVHGTGRNAQEYFDSVADIAEDTGALANTTVIAPRFQTEEDGPEDGDAYWTNSGESSWKDGGGAISPEGLSSFEAIDEVLAALADQSRFPKLGKITIVGHSAGAQFTQRYAAGGHAPEGLDVRYVAANPSSYLYLTPERPVEPESCPEYDDYKYGLKKRNVYMNELTEDQIREQYAGRRVTYLLGEEDTEKGGSLDEKCPAQAQGEHRLARGQAYYKAIKKELPSAKHAEALVPGVGHDHGAMFGSPEGRRVIFEKTDNPSPDPSGSPTGSPDPSPTGSPDPTDSPGKPGKCTLHAKSMEDAQAAKPGDVVCFDGDFSGERLKITKGGTKEKPVTYAGNGQQVKGIDIEADHVIVDGYKMTEPQAPGVRMTGNNISLQHTTITRPVDGDGDGIRFFGNDLKILYNTVSETSNEHGHADCMQTYASDSPPSQRVRIEGNRCEKIDNMCLMAEGPNDGEGDGEGKTSDFVIRKNFCETLKASQTIMIEDIQDCRIFDNEFAGPTHHAIGLAINSTGAHVGGNKVHPDTEYEVGIDDSSREGYEGPEPGGAP